MSGRRQRQDRCGRFCPRLVSTAIVGLVLIVGASVLKPAPLLVWNASASAPVGLYRRLPAASLQHGDMVLVRLPDQMRGLAGMRRYLPEKVPLIKRVAGLVGDRICACDATIFVNGRALATRREADRIGRPLPRWDGCRTLDADAVFLLMPDAPDSFDGRYFGAIPLTSIIERLAPLWTE